MQSVNLTNHFLIAMPNMADPYFAKSLTYICEHNEQGALGVVVNRPTEMTLGALFEQVDIPLSDKKLSERPVYFGGPVQVDRGFVLHRPVGVWQSTLAVAGDVGLTTSRDILEALGKGGGPDSGGMLVSLGYSGWAPGQIEHEIGQNAWLTVAASTSILFDIPPEARLGGALGLLGIDAANLSEQAGHA